MSKSTELITRLQTSTAAIKTAKAERAEEAAAQGRAAGELFNEATNTLAAVNTSGVVASVREELGHGITQASSVPCNLQLGPRGYDAVQLASTEDGNLRFQLHTRTGHGDPKPVTQEVLEEFRPKEREQLARAMGQSLENLAAKLEAQVEIFSKPQ
jgi:hypothetical protein